LSLIPEGAPVRYFVPADASLGDTWTQPEELHTGERTAQILLVEDNPVDAKLVREDGFLDDVPNDARLRNHGSVAGNRHIAKGVQAKLDLFHHRSEPI
jgi:hypothetical protein